MGAKASFPLAQPINYREWCNLFKENRFDEEDLTNNASMLDWMALLEYHPLSIGFLSHHMIYIDWYALSCSQFLNDDIIRHFIDYIMLDYAIQNKALSQEYATELLLDTNLKTDHKLDLLEFYKFPEEVLHLIELPEYVNSNRHPSFRTMYDWIVRYQDLSEQYISDMEHHFNAVLLDQLQPLKKPNS